MMGLNPRNGSARPSIVLRPPMTEDQTLIANGTVDRQGRLVSADPRLLALQLGAGGEVGGGAEVGD